jgi:hypothetical protein
LTPGEVTVPAVRSALPTVLGTVTSRLRAQKLADEVAAMPATEDVAAALAR